MPRFNKKKKKTRVVPTMRGLTLEETPLDPIVEEEIEEPIHTELTVPSNSLEVGDIVYVSDTGDLVDIKPESGLKKFIGRVTAIEGEKAIIVFDGGSVEYNPDVFKEKVPWYNGGE